MHKTYPTIKPKGKGGQKGKEKGRRKQKGLILMAQLEGATQHLYNQYRNFLVEYLCDMANGY